MRNRRYFQLHPILLALCLPLLTMLTPFVVIFPETLMDYIQEPSPDNIKYPIGVLGIIVLICWFFLVFEHLHFTFRDDTISMTDDWLGKNEKVQFKTVVRYDDIVDISLVRSTNNSHNKRIRANQPQSSLTKLYLQLTTRSGKKEWMYIKYFTKRQQIKIITELIQRMERVGNFTVFKTAQDIINELGPDQSIW